MLAGADCAAPSADVTPVAAPRQSSGMSAALGRRAQRRARHAAPPAALQRVPRRHGSASGGARPRHARTGPFVRTLTGLLRADVAAALYRIVFRNFKIIHANIVNTKKLLVSNDRRVEDRIFFEKRLPWEQRHRLLWLNHKVLD